MMKKFICRVIMRKYFFTFFLLIMSLMLVASAVADVRVSKVFTDNAVLQRDVSVKVWGWAEAGEHVSVSFADQKVETKADENGKWLITLLPLVASTEGKDLTISGKNTLVFRNVVVGDVWICSGQSNMEWKLGQQSGTPEEVNGDYSYIRYNRAAHTLASSAQEEINTTGWRVCKEGAQAYTTAVGFHFAVRMFKETGVPVGLIDSNWGGSNINSWMPDEAWFLLPELKKQGENIKANREKGQKEECGGMYYAMIAPWCNYAIKGCIWYQGCSNAGEGDFYYFKQKAMIQQWRKNWNQGDFPFYWVQLANFRDASDDPNTGLGWTAIRDAQTRCMEVVNTGQAVTIDLGEAKDIHPRNKYDVGNRLALWALAKDYGKKVECCSPMFKELKVSGSKVTVTFSHVGGGLVLGEKTGREPMKVLEGGVLKRFAVAGEDKKFFWAEAKIIGKDTVELFSEEVKAPIYVRYAWQMNPAGCNLYSAQGLPVTPFRTDK
ncbi:MAG: sialate O-acetylesterase [Planctomycetia bacterium]|nr:sialate O-acetylesterase [Planctomycetia bacterium]